jgi:hypothetical protein
MEEDQSGVGHEDEEGVGVDGEPGEQVYVGDVLADEEEEGPLFALTLTRR